MRQSMYHTGGNPLGQQSLHSTLLLANITLAKSKNAAAAAAHQRDKPLPCQNLPAMLYFRLQGKGRRLQHIKDGGIDSAAKMCIRDRPRGGRESTRLVAIRAEKARAA